MATILVLPGREGSHLLDFDQLAAPLKPAGPAGVVEGLGTEPLADPPGRPSASGCAFRGMWDGYRARMRTAPERRVGEIVSVDYTQERAIVAVGGARRQMAGVR